jgi:hypothetical protein
MDLTERKNDLVHRRNVAMGRLSCQSKFLIHSTLGAMKRVNPSVPYESIQAERPENPARHSAEPQDVFSGYHGTKPLIVKADFADCFYRMAVYSSDEDGLLFQRRMCLSCIQVFFWPQDCQKLNVCRAG